MRHHHQQRRTGDEGQHKARHRPQGVEATLADLGRGHTKQDQGHWQVEPARERLAGGVDRLQRIDQALRHPPGHLARSKTEQERKHQRLECLALSEGGEHVGGHQDAEHLAQGDLARRLGVGLVGAQRDLRAALAHIAADDATEGSTRLIGQVGAGRSQVRTDQADSRHHSGENPKHPDHPRQRARGASLAKQVLQAEDHRRHHEGQDDHLQQVHIDHAHHPQAAGPLRLPGAHTRAGEQAGQHQPGVQGQAVQTGGHRGGGVGHGVLGLSATR